MAERKGGRLTEVIPASALERHPPEPRSDRPLPVPDRAARRRSTRSATDGLDAAVERAGGVEQVLLTNRHHLRAGRSSPTRSARRSAAACWLHEFQGRPRPLCIAYGWGEELTEGITAPEVGSPAPDDGALHITIGPAPCVGRHRRRRRAGTRLRPRSLMDDPEETKDGSSPRSAPARPRVRRPADGTRRAAARRRQAGAGVVRRRPADGHDGTGRVCAAPARD